MISLRKNEESHSRNFRCICIRSKVERVRAALRCFKINFRLFTLFFVLVQILHRLLNHIIIMQGGGVKYDYFMFFCVVKGKSAAKKIIT